jgi:biopolymer transport protein ExbB
MGGQDANGTYDVDQVVLLHLAELEGPPQDSTAYQNNASEYSGGQGLPSIIGSGMTLSGMEDSIVIQGSPSMDFSAGFTFSAWVRISEPLEDACLLSMEDEKAGIRIGFDDSMIYCSVTTEIGNITSTEKTTGLAPMTWQHVAVKVVPDDRITIYLDGIESTWVELENSIPAISGDMVIGNSNDRERSFIGDLDEVSISKTARTDSYVRLMHLSQRMDLQFVEMGLEEAYEGGGLPVFYLATVIKNVTLDGWIIIMILALFAVLSWVVILSKAFQLILVERDNRSFMEPFTGNGDLLSIDRRGDDFSESSLFKLYRSGCENMKKLIHNTDPDERGELRQKDINSIRTNMEESYIKEDQKLNSWLVLLTMAITGGPFLGLLGTVWGVMNTFAAMAEAGEANIMAIAPGVASALSTTVFGLIVAIPALFGYNFLASRIKNISAEMDIFMEQFLLKVEDTYGGSL